MCSQSCYVFILYDNETHAHYCRKTFITDNISDMEYYMMIFHMYSCTGIIPNDLNNIVVLLVVTANPDDVLVNTLFYSINYFSTISNSCCKHCSCNLTLDTSNLGVWYKHLFIAQAQLSWTNFCLQMSEYDIAWRCYPVCGLMHIKEPLLLIRNSSLCGSRFPLTNWVVLYHISINKMCWVCC